LIWITKYGKGVLIREKVERARQLVKEVCTMNRVSILAGHVSKDHILVSIHQIV